MILYIFNMQSKNDYKNSLISSSFYQFSLDRISSSNSSQCSSIQSLNSLYLSSIISISANQEFYRISLSNGIAQLIAVTISLYHSVDARLQILILCSSFSRDPNLRHLCAISFLSLISKIKSLESWDIIWTARSMTSYTSAWSSSLCMGRRCMDGRCVWKI